MNGPKTFRRSDSMRFLIRILPMLLTIDRAAFHRKDDPLHEFSELLLHRDGAHLSIWEVFCFLDGKDADWNPQGVKRREKIAFGWEAQMRLKFAEDVDRLVQQEGFTLCDPRIRNRSIWSAQNDSEIFWSDRMSVMEERALILRRGARQCGARRGI